MVVNTVCISTDEYIRLRLAADKLKNVEEAMKISGDTAAWLYLSADETRMEKYTEWCRKNGAVPF